MRKINTMMTAVWDLSECMSVTKDVQWLPSWARQKMTGKSEIWMSLNLLHTTSNDYCKRKTVKITGKFGISVSLSVTNSMPQLMAGGRLWKWKFEIRVSLCLFAKKHAMISNMKKKKPVKIALWDMRESVSVTKDIERLPWRERQWKWQETFWIRVSLCPLQTRCHN